MTSFDALVAVVDSEVKRIQSHSAESHPSNVEFHPFASRENANAHDRTIFHRAIPLTV